MPSLSLVGVLALLAAVLLARSPLRAPLAWLLAVVAGAAVTFWQALEMVGPGNLEARVDAIYIRFQTWFQLAFSGGISNDSLPFNTLVIGLTWLGVFLFGWSVFRWHNAWLGLIPGGAVLFLDMALVGDSLPVAVFFYVLIGFLLIMRSNLMNQMSRWRTEGVNYPPLISLSFLHYSVWAVLLLMTFAMIAPAGPFATPKPAEALIQRFEGLGVHFVRLAGPLHANKIVPAHHYTSVLPFQGSINLGERHLLSVTLNGASLEGPIILRGAVYDEYVSGGWKAGPREEVELPPEMEDLIRAALEDGSLQGELISLTVTVEAKSVVGTVLFSPGEPVSTDVPARFDVPADSLPSLTLSVPPASGPTLPDAVVVRPEERLAEGESYRLVGLLQTASPDELQAAGAEYPLWISDQYLRLPDSLPPRVQALARGVAGQERTAYDRTKAIESYLRQFPVAYAIPDTPPGRDTVDYFLFESRQGYFNYHASAMVVMLRAVGVPARLAVGFIVDQADIDAASGSYAVRDQNAYAWPEVYFPDQGWLAFNPHAGPPGGARFRAEERGERGASRDGGGGAI
jgi:transglutaminase-like putative cysteine protease